MTVLVPAWAMAGGTEPTTADLMAEIQALKARVAELEAQVAKKDVKTTAGREIDHADKHILHKAEVEPLFEAAGFEIGAGVTFIVQGTPNANNAGGDEDSRFDGSWTAEIEIQKAFGDFGLAYVLFEPGQGDCLGNDLALFSPANYDASDTGANPTVTEFWYEHYLFDEQVTITGGKIHIPNYMDNNEYANNENTQFISGMFRNSDAIDFPDDNGLGLRVQLAPKDLEPVVMDLMWTEENADWNAISDHPFLGAQLNFMPAKAFDYDEDMWAGNYRVYYWYNGADHTRFKDAEKTKERNQGFGVSWDQKLGEVFGAFGRFNWADGRVSTIEYEWSTGLQMTGLYWGREQDIFGVGVGQAIPSDQYGDAGNPHDNETHIETYYSFKVNDHLAFSPDFQVIWDPNGVGNENDGDNDTIFIYGMRAHVGF